MNFSLVIISFLEGLTEFLPISSTAHLILASKVLNVDTSDSYIKFFLLFVQFGALLAGFLIFYKRIFSDKKLFINICISFLPSAVLGFIFYKAFKSLLEGNIFLLSTALLVGGCLFIFLEKKYMPRRSGEGGGFGRSEITTMDALVVGVAQSIAIIPGVSRSGATIVAGIFRGIKKAVIFEYTFILALPTLFVAVLYDAYKSREILSQLHSTTELFVGFILSFIVAAVTLNILRKRLPTISLSAFGWYRVILAIIILPFFL